MDDQKIKAELIEESIDWIKNPADVVLLTENQSPRNRWPMAKVVATHPDDQGQLRSVTMLRSNGDKLE